MADRNARGGVMLLACSGGSNVGQVANDCARRLAQLGRGRMFCAVGVAGGLEMPNGSTFVETARAAGVRVAIDGCAVRCVGRSLENAGLAADVQVILNEEMPMQKAYAFDFGEVEVARAAKIVEEKLEALGS
ncbi:MAG: putative zinc-binding protein [Fimbriimonadales bacterium]|nr:putative zinc-binding protein [Fimbriimonadales bacterium]